MSSMEEHMLCFDHIVGNIIPCGSFFILIDRFCLVTVYIVNNGSKGTTADDLSVKYTIVCKKTDDMQVKS